MKLNRIRKNARYAMGYSCSSDWFKRNVRSSPDSNIARVPARTLAKIIKETIAYYNLRVIK